MIIDTQEFLLEAEAAGAVLWYPRIGHKNWLRESGVIATASSEAEDYDADATLEPSTALFWKGTAVPVWLQYDLGAARAFDYIGIASHDLGDKGAYVDARASDDPSDFESYVKLPGTSGNYVSTPDNASLGITGDIDVRVKINRFDWTPASINYHAKQYASAGTGAWVFGVNSGGNLAFEWVDSGGTLRSTTSSVALGAADLSTFMLRATLDVDNGAGGHVVRYWYSEDYDPDTGIGTWLQLGTDRNAGAFTTSIRNTTDEVRLGDVTEGRIYWCQIRNGIDGNLVAAFDANQATSTTATTVTAAPTGEVWTINKSGSPASELVYRRFGPTVNVGDNKPLMILDSSREARHVRLYFKAASAPPRVAVVYIGELLIMQKPPRMGLRPPELSRFTELAAPMSRGGHFLSQTIRRMGYKSNLSFQALDDDWYRANFDPFVEDATQWPFFLAWNPVLYPDAVMFCVADTDIAPSYSHDDKLDVAFPVIGFA